MKQRKREKHREGGRERGRGEWVRKKEIHPGTSRNGHRKSEREREREREREKERAILI